MKSTLFVALSLFTSVASAGKRGLAWPWYSGTLNPAVLNNGHGKVVAIYDWETYPPPSINGNGGLGFIGMQRCLDCDSSPISQLASRQKSQGWSTVFSLNEPDINGISPSTAAKWYIKNMNPLAIKKALPSVTSSTSHGQGLDWLAQMVDACAGRCYADYINLHWYGKNFAEFKSHIIAAHKKFPTYAIVITEFALAKPSGGQAAQIAFFKEAFAWLDAKSYVTLYFPFVATTPALMAAHDGGAVSYVGTKSTLFTNTGKASAVGKLLLS